MQTDTQIVAMLLGLGMLLLVMVMLTAATLYAGIYDQAERELRRRRRERLARHRGLPFLWRILMDHNTWK